MSDRFAWGAGDLTPDEVVESARLGEGRHSAGWREDLHPRADDGRFGHGGGGSASGGDGSPAGGSPSAGGGRRSSGSRDAAEVPRGMPSVLASARVPSRNGASFAMERHTDGGLTISDGHHSTKLSKYKASELMSLIRNGNSDEMDIGQEWWVKGDSTVGADGERLPPRPLAMLARTGKDSYELKVGDDNQTYDDIRASTGVTATESGLNKIEDAYKRFSGATRVDTGNGDVDLFATDDKKIAFRMLGDDGKPIEVKLDPRDYGKIAKAVNVVIDGFDEMETFTKHPPGLADDEDLPAVTSVTFPTKAGKIRVELIGEWKGSNPGDRLRIEAADDSWAVIVDGPQQGAWSDAMDAVADAGEDGDFYHRGIGEGARRPRKPRNGQVSLVEAAPGRAGLQATTKGRYNVLLIEEGQGSSGYYTADVLRRYGPSIFPAGTRMNMDHPTPTEQAERPEGSTLTWASVTTTDPYWDPAQRGLVADIKVFPHWRDFLNEEYAKELGLSIRATGTVEWGEIDGKPTKIVTSLDEGISVDWVTKAGAGGRVLELIESARADGELLEEKGNLAPPFTKADGKAKKGEKPDDEDAKADDEKDDEDEDNAKKKDGKGKMPAFLKAKFKAKESDVSEAGTVGAGFESHIHSGFTALADGMYGEGRLNRPERLTLSTAIGEALAAFMARVEADQPHLYQRGLFDDPPAVDSAAMTEHTTMEGAPMSGSTKQDTPPERGTDVTESARVNELTTALAEARGIATALTEAQVAANEQIAELRERLDASDSAKQELANDRSARKALAEALKGSGLPEVTHTRVTESVVRDLPVDDDGDLDTAKLAEAIKSAIDDKKIEIASLAEASGIGVPRGLGESHAVENTPEQAAAVQTGLTEAYKSRGMSAEAAALAAAGRPF